MDTGFVPSVLSDSLELYIGSPATGRARAGNTTLDTVVFTRLPGQAIATTFTPADVGCTVAIIGGGAVDPLMPPIWFVQGATFVTTIAAYVSASEVTLTAAPITAIFNTGFPTVIVYRRCLMQLDQVEFSSSIAPGTRDTLKFTALGIGNPYIDRFTVLAMGQPVYFRSSDSAVGDIFGGYIDTVTVGNQTGYPSTFSWVCSCASWAGIAIRRVVPPTTPQVLSAAGETVFTQIVLDYLNDEGVSVVAPTGLATIGIACPIGARINQLLDQVVQALTTDTDPWYWYVDAWRVFHLARRAATTAPWDVDGGSDLFAGQQPLQLTVERTHDQMANFVYACGANVLLNALSVSLIGDGTAKTFSLPQPVGAAPVITLNGGAQTVGISGIDTGKDWYWNQGSTTLAQDPLGTALTVTDTLVVEYQTLVPAVAQSPNVGSLQQRSDDEATSGNYDYVIQESQPITPAGLLSLAETYAAQYGNPAQTVTASTLRPGLKTAQIQHIRLPVIGVDDDFLIATIRMTTKSKVIQWDYSAFTGANVGSGITGLVQFINRAGALLQVTPTVPITQAGSVPQQSAVANLTTSATLPNLVQVGDVIIGVFEASAASEFGPGLPNPPTVTDSLGNTWVQAQYLSVGFFFPNSASIMWTQSTAAGACTVTCAQAREFVIAGFPAGATAVDVAGAAAGSNPTITLTQDNCLVVTGLLGVTSSADPTTTAPEQVIGFVRGSLVSNGVAMSYSPHVATGAFTSSLTGQTIGALSVAFKIAAPAPPAPPVSVAGNPAGTVTHSLGALTSGAPVIGHGGADITVGTKTGVTSEFVTATGAATSGAPLLYDGVGNAIAGALGQLVPAGGSTGQVLAKASGTAYDTHWAASTPSKPTVHTEPLTDGDSNFIFAAGDVVCVVWIPN